MGGPDICPSCDCGISPEVKKLERENWALQSENAFLLALLAKERDEFGKKETELMRKLAAYDKAVGSSKES
jgi:hypothetical protein